MKMKQGKSRDEKQIRHRQKNKRKYQEKLIRNRKMKTTRAEVDPERKMKIPREITSLDDEELWSGFETEEVDRILSGETEPKTMIITDDVLTSQYQPSERGPMIARELLKVFPNSEYRRFGRKTMFYEIIDYAKDNGFTSLILIQSGFAGAPDDLSIISLLNGAVSNFMLLNFIKAEEIPNHASPTIFYPRVRMVQFTSPSSVGTSRMIQSLFPMAPLSYETTAAWFQNQDGVIFFRHYSLHVQEALAGETPRVTKQECGPQFILVLTSVEKYVFDTDEFEVICKPPARSLSALL